MQHLALATVLLLLAVLYIAVEYANLRSRYDNIYSWYAALKLPPGAQFSIGPTRIALGYDRPWMAALHTRPIPQTAAEFLMRLISQVKVNPLYLYDGPNHIHGDLQSLDWYTASKEQWADPTNPLFAMGIPYNSPLVQGYIALKTPSTARDGDMSLLTLWNHGFEEYVRQRFSGSATSVLQEWNFMFGAVPSAGVTPSSCGALNLVSGAASAGVGAAGVGAMVGSAGGPIGTGIGAAIGFVFGAGVSLLGKTECF